MKMLFSQFFCLAFGQQFIVLLYLSAGKIPLNCQKWLSELFQGHRWLSADVFMQRIAEKGKLKTPNEYIGRLIVRNFPTSLKS
jgi:hypothetical protein